MANNYHPAGRPREVACPPVQRPPRRPFLDDVVAALKDLKLTDRVAKCPPGRTFNRDFRVAIHEIGHLLLPRGSQPESGLMRGRWTIRNFRRIDVANLEFSPLQASQIRVTIENVEAAGSTRTR